MTLESTCLEHGEHTHKVTEASGQTYSYKAREERNITIADSDMAQGMSGAPLFNINGELIGIASTVIVDAFPYNYKRSLGSVYSKSENILELLK